MQAMACGIPVITTAVGAIGEIVQDGRQGLIVPPRDVTALAQAIERMQASPTLREQLGQAGLAQARERFSRDRMLDGMEAVYAGALAMFSRVDGAVAP
jgi:glycosyltransferase involved in cell wall biosynthesis